MNSIHQHANKQEQILIMLAGLVLLGGILVVSLATNHWDKILLASVIGLIAAWLAGQTYLRRAYSGDQLLLPLVLLLSAIGLVMLYRLKPQLIMIQLLWNCIGWAACLATVFLFRRLTTWSRYQYLIGLSGICLLLSPVLIGTEIGGNKNWLVFGGFRFQPSEFARIFIVLFLAAYLTEKRELLLYATRRFGPFDLPLSRFSAPLFVFWGITMLMLIMQRDLGSALLYFSTTLAMIYLASGKLSYISFGLILFVCGAAVSYGLFPHVKVRFDIWLNPWADPTGTAYQIVQSLFSLGSGGLLGSGLTFGYPDLIPEVHTDFIFAAIGEELGFIGAAGVLLTYMLLIIRAFRVALKTDDPFLQMVAGGLTVFLSLQVLFIVGGVTKFLPLTGITLPFISYGGSSLVSNYIILGILLDASAAGDGCE